MDTFEEKVQAMKNMAPEDVQAAVEKLKSMCICPTCPVARDMGLKYTFFCTRGAEKAQRYEHTVWGTKMV
ncbi:DUF2769 domain-containing protein [Methanofollis ethanolicus]|uniref:DUF2769 domain-containing protein n=1 Tax=Methanofollis ethanolicus TaxID=488124 RepID=UPI000833774C|nr:DUF2769 domain-containing protein [Methanofollis ethanolicus]